MMPGNAIDRLLQTLLDWFDKYEDARWWFSRTTGRKVFSLLTFLEKESKKGLLFRRIHRRLRDRYQSGTNIPGRNFRDFDGIDSVFTNAFHYRLYPYSKILALLFFAILFDYFSSCSINTSNTNLYGSIFTLIGSLIFARGLFQGYLGLYRGASNFNHTQNYDILSDIPDETDWNELVSLAYSSADAVWATFYVLIGFVCIFFFIFPVNIPISC